LSAKNSPSILNRTISLPFSTTKCEWPGATSLVLAALTNSPMNSSSCRLNAAAQAPFQELTRASHMDCSLVDGERGFLDGLVEGRTRVAGAGQVLSRAAELHQHSRLGNHGAGVGADDVNAKHAIGIGLRKNFYEAFSSAVDLCAPVGSEGELTDLVVDASLL